MLGQRECEWLDVKSGVYPLDQATGPHELAKDVAAFANTRHGGLLVVGFSTRKEYEEEIVDALVDRRSRPGLSRAVLEQQVSVNQDWHPLRDRRLIGHVPVGSPFG